MAGTSYLVFQRVEVDAPIDFFDWREIGKYTAASADAAKQAAALEHGAGTYAATPARGWQPSAFKVEPRAVAVKT